MSKEIESDFYCNKPSEIPCSKQCERCKSVSGKPLTDPMNKSIEELANVNYPLSLWSEEESLVRKLAFKNGYELANSQTTNHLKTYTEDEVLELLHKLMAYDSKNIELEKWFKKHKK